MMKSPEDPPIAPAVAAYERLANNSLFQAKGNIHAQCSGSLWETHHDVVVGTARVQRFLEVDPDSDEFRTSSPWFRSPALLRHYRFNIASMCLLEDRKGVYKIDGGKTLYLNKYLAADR